MVSYNLSIYAYGIALKIAALFHKKAKLWVEGRRNYFDRLPSIKSDQVIWFHCASLGEFEQARPIIESWKTRFPNDFILISFFSPSGYEVQKNYPFADSCVYLPLDTRKNAERFILHFNPKKAFFVKYEFWLNFIEASSRNSTELYSVSAVFRKEQRFFKWYGGPFRKALGKFNYFFVQNEESKVLLSDIGISQVSVTGDTRYDRVYDRVQSQKKNKLISSWVDNKKGFVIGSSWPIDEELIIPLLPRIANKFPIIIAPHEVGEKHILSILHLLTNHQLSVARYTQCIDQEGIPAECNVLILDCIGVLADAYKYGAFSYVGGAFGSGLHNILEPASFGLPVIFGPKHGKFPEAQTFINEGIGFSVSDQYSLGQEIEFILKNLASLQKKTEAFTASQRGAREKIFALLER